MGRMMNPARHHADAPTSPASCSRRAFLARTGAVLAAASIVRADTGGPRFGVRGPLPGNDLAGRARLVRKLGYDGIELGPEFLDEAPTTSAVPSATSR
jgi:hypothetical protein